MPSRVATASIAFCDSQPLFCSCARHRIGITADCWRPSGYLAICFLAHARLSAVNANASGCNSGGARRRTDMRNGLWFLRDLLDGAAARGVAALDEHRAPHHGLVFLQDKEDELP